MNPDERVVFVTVGSTRFDALISCVLTEDVVTYLRVNGFERMVVQTGNSVMPTDGQLNKDKDGNFRGQLFGLELEAWDFKPSLRQEYQRAALVIGHAGEKAFLELKKRPP
jgi:beta-1,4-N-acetylglucosaminyltransferase